MEPIYTVLIITLIIWAGIFGYMFYMDREVQRLKNKLENFEKKGSN